MRPTVPPIGIELDPVLRARLSALFEEGWAYWRRFDTEVRQQEWHPFVHGDYECVLRTLLRLRAPGRRFLEWGSATGVVTIMADFLGFDAYGIELDAELVRFARDLAERHASGAQFEAGSFLPSGYRWRPRGGDGRPGTIGEGASAYPALGVPLDDFDVVYAYPWSGEEGLMLDLMRRWGGAETTFLLYGGSDGMRVFRGGRPLMVESAAQGLNGP